MKGPVEAATDFRGQIIEQWLAAARAGKDFSITAVDAGFEAWMQQMQVQAKIAQHFMTTWMEVFRGASVQGHARTS